VDETKARKFLNLKLKQVHADQIGARPFVGPEQERVKVNEILDDLVSHYKRGGRRGIPREVTAQMTSHLKRVRDYFGEQRAVRVGSRDVEAFIARLKDEKRANATINRSLQLLSQAYQYAVSGDPQKLSRALKVERLDESGNRRKGKFTPTEAELVAASLPPYMSDVAKFAYETGARAGEILQLRWGHLDGDAIRVPGEITKNRDDRCIVLTDELEEILARRKRNTRPGCDLIFHNDGRAISDYRKCWHTACVSNGLGAYFCRDCRDVGGRYLCVLDAAKKCVGCGKKWEVPKYIGRFFHDFRRSAAHELWKAGSSAEECMTVTGHKTASMFKRYADLFTDEEQRARQIAVQQRRREWRTSQTEKVIAMPKRVAVQ
jgi:integrase